MNPVFMISAILPSMMTLVSNILGVTSFFDLEDLPPPTDEISFDLVQADLISLPLVVAMTIPRYPSNYICNDIEDYIQIRYRYAYIDLAYQKGDNKTGDKP